MNKNIAVKIHNVSKIYKLYDKPIDRAKEALHPFKKKYHKEFYALKNINLEIKKGEVLGIVGVNGAGKSTLLKIIAGILTPTRGRITINGKLNAILELSSGMNPELTGRQNIKLNLKINQVDENVEQLTQEIIEFADIGEHIDQVVKTYSSGMKGRLGFGLATATNPDILIVDEVLAVGDVLFKRKCYGKIEKLFKDGKTVIFVSHSAQSVIEFCSRAVLLYDREIIMNDLPKYVTDHYEKLIFSKDRQKVIKKLTAMSEIEESPSLQKEENIIINKDNNFYIPEFQVQPTAHNFGYDVELSNFKILNSNNQVVNVLNHGKEYTFVSIAKLKVEGEITLSAHIVTPSGFIVSGASMSNKEEKYFVSSNKTIQFNYKFKCYLTKNDYFININISLLVDDSYKLIHKTTNAFVFKVEKNRDSYIGQGVVDLEQSLKIENLNETT